VRGHKKASEGIFGRKQHFTVSELQMCHEEKRKLLWVKGKKKQEKDKARELNLFPQTKTERTPDNTLAPMGKGKGGVLSTNAENPCGDGRT